MFPPQRDHWMGMQRCLFQNFSWNHFWGNLSSCEVAKFTNFAQIEVHGNSHHIAKPLSRLSICAVGNIRQENPLLNQRKRFQWIEVGIIHKVNTIATHSKSALLVIPLTMFLDINGSAFLVYLCWTGQLRLACKTHNRRLRNPFAASYVAFAPSREKRLRVLGLPTSIFNTKQLHQY